MPAAATRPVTLNDGGNTVTVDVRTASAATLDLRSKVDKFLRRSYIIWKEQPDRDTGLVATAAVLDEVIHAATAFHANGQSTVDLVWIKKDMPLEALKDPDVAYWKSLAGPAARLEQREIRLTRDIPETVMDEIGATNNHDLIAHYLYAFIDFWCIVLKHWIIWLACIFWYGYLCIIQPTIIVGESSKVFNIIRYLTPQLLFDPNLTEDDFQAFLNGDFTFAFLRQMTIVRIQRRKWDDYAMSSSDYLHVVGIPVIQAYGPFDRHYALYIPKFHPYAPYHIQSLSSYIIEVDRYVRLMIELAQHIVVQAAPIPQDATRKDCLSWVRSRIIQDASRIGLLAKLNAAKARLALANKGFAGSRSTATRARMAEEIASGSRQDTCGSDGGEIYAVGDRGSLERKLWVIQEINNLRDQLERGHCVGLLACPHQFLHGTLDHAQWLFSNCTEGAELINSASGYSVLAASKEPTPEEDMRRTAQGDAVSAATFSPNNMTLTASEALKILARPFKARKNDKVYLCRCPHCEKSWLVNDAMGYCCHDCIEVRKKYLPGLDACIEAQKAIDAQSQAEREDSELTPLMKKSGVTRCIVPVFFEWKVGGRIVAETEIFDGAAKKKKKPTRRPTQGSPAWERAMDDRGRITAYSLERRRISYAFQLLGLPEAEGLFAQDGQSLKAIEGFLAYTVQDALTQMAQAPVLEQKLLEKAAKTWVIAVEGSETATSWTADQIKAFEKGDAVVLKVPEFGLEDILAAAERRITLKRLRPHYYNPESKEDSLPAILANLSNSQDTAAETL